MAIMSPKLYVAMAVTNLNFMTIITYTSFAVTGSF